MRWYFTNDDYGNQMWAVALGHQSRCGVNTMKTCKYTIRKLLETYLGNMYLWVETGYVIFPFILINILFFKSKWSYNKKIKMKIKVIYKNIPASGRYCLALKGIIRNRKFVVKRSLTRTLQFFFFGYLSHYFFHYPFLSYLFPS